MKLPCMRLTGVGLYSLSRLAVGYIKEIIVRWSGGGNFENDNNAHIVISGDGKAFTNNFSLTTQKYDPYYEKGIAVVSLLGGHGACLADANEKLKIENEKLWKDVPKKDYNPPVAEATAPLTGGTEQCIDFGSSPPNDRQLNSLAHVLGIMCLGLRLNVDSIRTLAEVVSLDEELKIKNEKLWKDVPKKIISKDAINLAFYPNYEGTAGDVIRKRTQVVLDAMKKGLYKTIKPELADVPLVVS